MPKKLKVYLPLGGLAILGITVLYLRVRTPDGVGPRGGITPQIAAGDGHAIFLAANGRLYAWGRNDFGQLGDGTGGGGAWGSRQAQPVAVKSPDSVWVKVTAGDNHSLAIRSDGTLWAWGRNDFGQLGDGEFQHRSVPTQIGNDTN